MGSKHQFPQRFGSGATAGAFSYIGLICPQNLHPHLSPVCSTPGLDPGERSSLIDQQ